jgi:hypothetical protein
LITLTDAEIDSLQYKDASNNNAVTAVKLGDKMLLRCFLSYVSHCHSEGVPIGDNFDQVNQGEFDAYRIDPRYMLPIVPRASVPSSTAAAKTVENTGFVPQYSPADMFCRGIKQDYILFPTLKDEKFNDNWHRSFVNQARAQDVSEVLDPSYVPSTTSEQEIFTEKQKYVYAVLESKVLADRGKAIERPFTSADCNLSAELIGGEELEDLDPADDPIIKLPDGDINIKEGTKQLSTQSNPQEPNISTMFNPEDLVCKTFLMDTDNDGQKVRAILTADDFASKSRIRAITRDDVSFTACFKIQY